MGDLWTRARGEVPQEHPSAARASVSGAAPRIDAHVAVVPNGAHFRREGAAFIHPVQWTVIQIFTSHFRRVTLIGPRIEEGEANRSWVRVPDAVEVRALREPGDRFASLSIQGGVPPRRLAALLRDVDVVLGRFPTYEAYHALRIAKQQGLVTGASLHGDWAEAYEADWTEGLRGLLAPLFVRRADRIYRWVAREVDLLFTVGEALREIYASERTDTCVFANYFVTERDLLERSDACAEPPIEILFVGSLTPRKGVARLIEALALVRARGTDARLTLVGRGLDRATLGAQVERSGLGDSVCFAGYADMGPALWRHYESHDLFVLPSLNAEGCPKVLVEAMAKSCPVIATRVGSIGFMIEPEVNGLLVDPGSAEQLAAAIERVVVEPELRRALVRGGLAFAEANLYARQIERVGDVLRRALLPRFGEWRAPDPRPVVA